MRRQESTRDVERVAEVVLYEGYLLYPYRRSAMKNQQRWAFGGVYPRRWSEASGGDDPWIMQTQCLGLGDEETEIGGKVRFLQVVTRTVEQRAGGVSRPVEELRVGDQVFRPWEEAIEREVLLGGQGEGHGGSRSLRLGELLDRPRRFDIQILEGREEEPLANEAGETVGVLVRGWKSLRGEIELGATPLEEPGAFRLTVRIVNTTPLSGGGDQLPPRPAVLRETFVSTHTILQVRGGEFVSLLEPPEAYEEAAAACENLKTWPVLAGNPGERTTLLSSPIILYDYPQVAPESHGNLFDATEIDELLTLSVMTLTEEEKQEMRETDPRSSEILERTETLSPEQVMKLHGAIRSLRSLEGEES